MMTPHQELKAKYGYIKRANNCGNCVNFEPARLLGPGGVVKADLQDISTCAIGGFPVSAKACCTRHLLLQKKVTARDAALMPDNAKVSGAGTASAGLPGYAPAHNGEQK